MNWLVSIFVHRFRTLHVPYTSENYEIEMRNKVGGVIIQYEGDMECHVIIILERTNDDHESSREDII